MHHLNTSDETLVVASQKDIETKSIQTPTLLPAPTTQLDELDSIEFVPTSNISLRDSRRVLFRLLRACERPIEVFAFGRQLARVTRVKGEVLC